MRLGKPTMRFHVFPRSWQGYQDSCHWEINHTFLFFLTTTQPIIPIAPKTLSQSNHNSSASDVLKISNQVQISLQNNTFILKSLMLK